MPCFWWSPSVIARLLFCIWMAVLDVPLFSISQSAVDSGLCDVVSIQRDFWDQLDHTIKIRRNFRHVVPSRARFPWGPAANRLVGQKMSCKFLIASAYDYIRKTCLWLFGTRMLYHYLSAIAHVLIITWIILSMQRPFIHPYAYSILSYYLLLLLLLSLLYYCCYYFTTVTTIKLLLLINYCEQVYFQVQLNWQLIY
jgi:hypothetical protein